MDDESDHEEERLLLAEQLLRVGGGVKKVRSTAGGSANFKIVEDIKLASAYVFVTTNAAIGTDQDGNTFWEKIRENFIKRGGVEARTRVSLKNRFNKVLQAEINKYVGYLHSVLREYHSGWVIGDYTAKAKAMFQLKHGKTFKHDVVYSILKKALPKYEIVLASCDARVARALFLLDSDQDSTTTAAGEGTPDGDTITTIEDAANNSCLLVTPRPTVGKKRAKLAVFKQQQQQKRQMHNKRQIKVECDVVMPTKSDERNASLARIAAAAEAKNLLVQEQLMFQLFMKSPDSTASKAFFKQMSETYMKQLMENKKIVESSHEQELCPVPDRFDEDIDKENQIIVIVVDNDKDDKEEDDQYDNNYESDHHDDNQDSMFEPLPPTQLLVSALAVVTNNNNDDAVDTQMTTLSL